MGIIGDYMIEIMQAVDATTRYQDGVNIYLSMTTDRLNQ